MVRQLKAILPRATVAAGFTVINFASIIGESVIQFYISLLH